MWILRHHTNKSANIQLMQTKMLHWSAGGEELKQNKYERVTDKQNWNAGEKLRTQQKEEINKEMCLCCNKFVKTDVKFGQCGNWFHYICDGTTEEQVKKKNPECMSYIYRKDLTKFWHTEISIAKSRIKWYWN